MTAEQMWHAYCESSGVSEQTPYSAWAFCGGGAVGDELAQLVLAGTKTATASALLAFELEKEPLPEVGEYSVILFDSGEAAGVICDTKVTLVPFDEVSGAHAYREGEGDRSLAYWKKVHREAFTPDFEAAGKPFDEHGLCVLEEFALLYPAITMQKGRR